MSIRWKQVMILGFLLIAVMIDSLVIRVGR
jgi:hypothetical protein